MLLTVRTFYAFARMAVFAQGGTQPWPSWPSWAKKHGTGNLSTWLPSSKGACPRWPILAILVAILTIFVAILTIFVAILTILVAILVTVLAAGMAAVPRGRTLDAIKGHKPLVRAHCATNRECTRQRLAANKGRGGRHFQEPWCQRWLPC